MEPPSNEANDDWNSKDKLYPLQNFQGGHSSFAGLVSRRYKAFSIHGKQSYPQIPSRVKA